MPYLDLFIDASIAKNFQNPSDKEYKKLIEWLFKKGSILLSRKLWNEYNRAFGTQQGNSPLNSIIDIQTREGRLHTISNQQLKNHPFKNHQIKQFKSNKADHYHLFLITFSHRRLALVIDGNLKKDMKKLPGYDIQVESRPELIKYEK